MAERRMFAKTIVLSDAFLDMPLGSRALYFTLGMLADDDGFVNAPKSVMRQCGATEDDLKVLIAKKFVLEFTSGVVAIKHWKINNYIQTDRYKETKYLTEKQTLNLDENGAYTRSEGTLCIHNIGIHRIGKDSIGKVNNKENTKRKKRKIPDFLMEENNAQQDINEVREKLFNG